MQRDKELYPLSDAGLSFQIFRVFYSAVLTLETVDLIRSFATGGDISKGGCRYSWKWPLLCAKKSVTIDLLPVTRILKLRG